jgi:tetratricopeptide (TPR) repeat protein
MPQRTYMVVDARRDHSFRVPRPDLAERLGTPDACTGCHTGPGRGPAWAAAALRGWDAGREGAGHFGEALQAGRRRAPGAWADLAALLADEDQPAIVRASALQLLVGQGGPRSGVLAEWVGQAASSADPLLRLAAADSAAALAPAERVVRAAGLLRDPLRAVRVAAARALADVPSELWRPAARRSLTEALAEYRAVQRANADRPSAHVNLASLHALYGETAQARAAFAEALRLEPDYVPAWINLADLFRSEGNEADAEAALRRALAIAPDLAAAHHALGLSLARQEREEEALVALRRAAELAPRDPRFAYVYGVALHSAGRTDRALEILAAAHRRHPGDPELLWALATMARDDGRRAEALRWVDALETLLPGDPQVARLRVELQTPPAPAPGP